MGDAFVRNRVSRICIKKMFLDAGYVLIGETARVNF